MTKEEIRKKYKAKRKKLSDEDIEHLSLSIANQLLKLSIWDYISYHLFLSIIKHKEVNTEYILNILSGKDKNIIIPKSNFNTNTLTHYLLTDNTKIKTNSWGIPEPIDGIKVEYSKIDVVFVPLLAFDLKGYRVGYGKGFYDNFLKNCNTKTLKIGLSFFGAEDQIKDIYDGDISLDYCITPSLVYKF